MKKTTIATAIALALNFGAPPPTQAWTANSKLARCLYLNATRICYGGFTKVTRKMDSYSHIESCDISGMKDNGGMYTIFGLVAKMNSFYGPGIVDLDDHFAWSVNREEYCIGFDTEASFSEITQICVPGGVQGFHITTFHSIRWRESSRAWRGANIDTVRSLSLPWPINSCTCGDDGLTHPVLP